LIIGGVDGRDFGVSRELLIVSSLLAGVGIDDD
jgi:hypothetical protein